MFASKRLSMITLANGNLHGAEVVNQIKFHFDK